MARHNEHRRLARAVLEGVPVDWTGEAAGADPLVEQLRVVERIVGLHRQHPQERPSGAAASADDGARDRVGQLWNHLEILECLGRGAFGAVYRAWDPRLERNVALKILPARTSAAGELAPAVIEEGRRLAKVRHPGVVTVHGAEHRGEEIGIWMELVRGETLEARLRRGGAFGIPDVVRVGRDLCAAVSAVHAAGLLHRDIKAQNVIQATDGRTVLVDFGAGHDHDMGAPAYVAGTPLYLSPEVLNGAPATVQSDIYAVGVLLFHLLTGGYPVTGDTLAHIAHMHATGGRVRLRTARRDATPHLARVVERAIEPDPERRYRDADALGCALTSMREPRLMSRRTAVAVVVGGVAAGAWWRNGALPAPASRQRLAVLPFQARDGVEETLADGLARELQRALPPFDNFELLSFAPDLRARPGIEDPVAAGRSIGADLVIDGSVSDAGGPIRMHASLIRVHDGSVLWSDTVDSDPDDLPLIEDDVTVTLIEELRGALQLPRRQRIAPDAYEDFLRAREIQRGRGVAYLQEAIALYRSVVDREPEYAPALAGLATSLVAEARLTDKEPPELMKTAASRAHDLAPFNAEVQLAMGNVHAADGRWTLADAAFRQAIAIDPSHSYASTEFVLSSLLPQTRYDDALEVLERAIALDPISLDLWRAKALIEVDSTRYEEAIESGQLVIARDPSYSFAKLWLGRALALSNRLHDALEVYGDDPATAAYRGYALARLDRTPDALALLAGMEAEPYRQMLIYGGLNDKERAFEALARTMKLNRWRAATWMSRPEVALLHDDERYVAHRKALGLPPHRLPRWWDALSRRLRGQSVFETSRLARPDASWLFARQG